LEESNEKKKSFDKTREEQKKIQKSIATRARRIKFDFFGSVGKRWMESKGFSDISVKI
jgi:hypothetical protein